MKFMMIILKILKPRNLKIFVSIYISFLKLGVGIYEDQKNAILSIKNSNL